MNILLFFLFPGYIFLFFSSRDVISVKKEQWPYLLEIGFCSAIIVLACKLFLVATYALLHKYLPDEQILRTLWHRFLPLEMSFTFIFSSFIALLAGITKGKIFPPKVVDDPYSYAVKTLIPREGNEGKNLTMISLVNGKHYVAVLLQADLGGPLVDRHLLIIPIISGRRQTIGSKNVLWLNTYYPIPDYEKISATNELTTLIPYREVVTLSEFDSEFHRLCTMAGTTVMGPLPKNIIEQMEARRAQRNQPSKSDRP